MDTIFALGAGIIDSAGISRLNTNIRHLIERSLVFDRRINMTPNITLDDLKAVCTAIEIAANRGAYQVSEMSMVGSCYDKLKAFLAAAEAQPVPPSSPVGAE
jgi:hypothetical protein